MPDTKFKVACVEKGLTAKMVSDLTGVKRKTIHSYFDGSRSPSRPTRIALREGLKSHGIDTQKLFD